MTQYEQEFMAIVPKALRNIVKELKLSNKLKAFELKLTIKNSNFNRDAQRDFCQELDDIMEGRD